MGVVLEDEHSVNPQSDPSLDCSLKRTRKLADC